MLIGVRTHVCRRVLIYLHNKLEAHRSEMLGSVNVGKCKPGEWAATVDGIAKLGTEKAEIRLVAQSKTVQTSR